MQRIIIAIIYCIIAFSQIRCGGSSDSAGDSVERLKSKSTYDGRDRLIEFEEFFYIADQNVAARSEISQPNKAGDLTIVKMTETTITDTEHQALEVRYDPESSKEIFRQAVTKSLSRVGGRLTITEIETRTEQDGQETKQVEQFDYRMLANMAVLEEKKTVENNVPIQIQTQEFDHKGRPMVVKVENGDGELMRESTYDWERGTFVEVIYNEAGKKVADVIGKMAFEEQQIIRLQEQLTSNTTQKKTICELDHQILTCKESTLDVISGAKISEDQTRVVIESEDQYRPLAEQHQRFDQDDRILLVADHWNYRDDRQVSKRVHQVESTKEIALTQFADEFEELYDFTLTRDFNQADLPVRELKDTDEPELDRLIKYSYN